MIGSEKSIGSYLAVQRELRGLSLEELAALTRIPWRSLERLEAGAFDGQSDGFARGFVRTVAVALGLDPVDTLTRMLAEPQNEDSAPPHWPPWGKPAVLGAAALLFAAVGLWLVSSLNVSRRADVSADHELVYRPDPVRDLAAGLTGMRPEPSGSSETRPERSDQP